MKKRQERAALVKEARAIHEKAVLEKRNLTKDEKSQFDGLIGKIEELAGDIERMEKQHALEREMNESIRSAPGQSFESSSNSFNGGEGNPGGDLRDGEVRGFRHGQQIAEYVRNNSNENINPNEWQLRRFLRGAVTGMWDGAELERRTHLEGTAGTGGVFVPSVVSANLIDLARNESRLSQAGLITIPMPTAKMVIGKVVSDPTPYWRSEGQQITESDASYQGVTLEAKTIAILTSCSVELLEDAAGFTSTIEAQIAAAIALEIDRVGLFGSGIKEPTGINNTDGVSIVFAGTADAGAVPTNHNAFSQACQLVMAANGNPTAAIYSPRTWGTLDRLLDGEGRPLQPPASYTQLKKLVTNQVPDTLTFGGSSAASAAFVGGFENVLMGIRSNINIEASRVAGSDAFSKMKVMIRAYARCDFAIARATHLCKIAGILA